MRPLLCAFVLFPMITLAQPDQERAVLQVIDGFFATMAERDSAGMALLVMPEGVFHAVAEGVDARPPQAITHGDFLKRLRHGTDRILERYWEPKVRVYGPIVTVTAPYDFHVNELLSHCGVDVFTLVRDHSSTWRISGGQFTMRKDGCPASPLGPVK